jgi:hypothetical protein
MLRYAVKLCLIPPERLIVQFMRLKKRMSKRRLKRTKTEGFF